MKTLIVYHSEHHGNTERLLEALEKQGDITLLQAADAMEADASGYELIGLASGIYYQSFHREILEWAQKKLPWGKRVFLLYTCGVNQKPYTEAVRQAAESRGAQVIGSFGCRGFDTFGPFKLVGGIAKGHPNEADIANAVRFFKGL